MESGSPSPIEAALEELPLFRSPRWCSFRTRSCRSTSSSRATAPSSATASLPTQRFAVALITDPRRADSHGNPPIAEVAGAGLIVEHHALPDGRSTLLLHGQARVRLLELPFVPPYRRARATLLQEEDREVTVADRTALLTSATAFSAEVQKQDPGFVFRLPGYLAAGALADHCAHHLLVDTTVRQALLGELDPCARVRTVTTELALQHAALLRETGGVLH